MRKEATMSDDLTMQQQQPELPIIIIESDDEPAVAPARANQPRRGKRWLRCLAIVAGIVALLLLGYHLYRHTYGIGIIASCTSAQNIALDFS